MLRNRTFALKQTNISRKEYLDIGCGPNTHADFINLDYGWRPSIDICWDITKGIPLSDSTLRGVFSEHCLEHLSFESVHFVFRECFRILKSNGSIRVVVPDGELYLTRYSDIVRKVSDEKMPYADYDVYQGLYTPIMSVNRVFRAHEHKFIYDFDTLRVLLEEVGFVQIKKESYSAGRDPRLLIDSENRAVESLYVEATKP